MTPQQDGQFSFFCVPPVQVPHCAAVSGTSVSGNSAANSAGNSAGGGSIGGASREPEGVREGGRQDLRGEWEELHTDTDIGIVATGD